MASKRKEQGMGHGNYSERSYLGLSKIHQRWPGTDSWCLEKLTRGLLSVHTKETALKGFTDPRLNTRDQRLVLKLAGDTQMTSGFTADVPPEGKREPKAERKDVFMVMNEECQLRITNAMKTSYKYPKERKTFSDK